MENEISIFVARIVALIYIPIGIAMITGQFKGKEIFSSFQKSIGLTLLMAIFGLILGTFLVHYHNIWVKDWPVLITILGWVAVIECVALIAFPKTILSIGSKISKNEKYWSIFALALGLLFGYFGFII